MAPRVRKPPEEGLPESISRPAARHELVDVYASGGVVLAVGTSGGRLAPVEPSAESLRCAVAILRRTVRENLVRRGIGEWSRSYPFLL
jgi:hypothetical protein